MNTEPHALTPVQQATVAIARELYAAHEQGRDALAAYLEVPAPEYPYRRAAYALAGTVGSLLAIIDDLTGGAS